MKTHLFGYHIVRYRFADCLRLRVARFTTVRRQAAAFLHRYLII